MPEYQFDLDPVHSVIRLTVAAETLTSELAEDLYIWLTQIASKGGPYAAIADLSAVTRTTVPTEVVRDFALRDPAVPGGRIRVTVAKAPSVYGLFRMIQLSRDYMGGRYEVVHSLEEAYEMVGVRPEDFTERLEPPAGVEPGTC